VRDPPYPGEPLRLEDFATSPGNKPTPLMLRYGAGGSTVFTDPMVDGQFFALQRFYCSASKAAIGKVANSSRRSATPRAVLSHRWSFPYQGQAISSPRVPAVKGSRGLLSRHLRHGFSRVHRGCAAPGHHLPRRHVAGDHSPVRIRAAPLEELCFTVSLRTTGFTFLTRGSVARRGAGSLLHPAPPPTRSIPWWHCGYEYSQVPLMGPPRMKARGSPVFESTLALVCLGSDRFLDRARTRRCHIRPVWSAWSAPPLGPVSEPGTRAQCLIGKTEPRLSSLVVPRGP